MERLAAYSYFARLLDQCEVARAALEDSVTPPATGSTLL